MADSSLVFPTNPYGSSTPRFNYTPTLEFPRWPGGGGGRASRRDITSSNTSIRQLQVTAEGAIVPHIYGVDRVGAKIYAVTRYGNAFYFGMFWCLGQVNDIALRVNNEPADPSEVTVTHYTGTLGQGVDPSLSNVIGGYNDTLVGSYNNVDFALAHSVVIFNPTKTSGVPRFSAEIQGFSLYDPRSDTTVYSDNPALALAHYLSQPFPFGLGKTVNWDSVAETANSCDALLDGSPRRRIGLALVDPVSPYKWVETLRTYAGCFVAPIDGEYHLIPDRPTSVSRSVTDSDNFAFQLRTRKRRDVPSVVRVNYTNRDNDKWKDDFVLVKSSGVENGTQLWRESEVNLHGIFDRRQAVREATERYNAARLLELEGTLTGNDKNVLTTIGDVIDVTDTIGVSGKAVRIIPGGGWDQEGMFTLNFAEYDEAVYSDEIATEPTDPDTPLPDPSDVPDVTGLSLSEEVYQKQDGTYSSRLRATWDDMSGEYPYNLEYQWRVTDSGGKLVWTGKEEDEEAVTGALDEQSTYTLEVRIISNLGFASENWTSGQLVAQGKQLQPGNVPQVTATQVGADAIVLEWQEAIDIDIYRYEVRMGSVGVAWADAEVVDRVDGLRIRIEGLAEGQHDFLVKALDSVRQYSPQATRDTGVIAPPQVPASISAFEVGGEVRLSWPAGTGYVSAYELRYAAPGTGWAGATQLNVVQTLREVTNEIPAGDFEIYLKAVDGAGNRSTGTVSTQVTVTLDTEAFLVNEYSFDNPTTTNMISWTNRYEGYDFTYYLSDGSGDWNSIFTNDLGTYSDPLLEYDAPTSSEWLSEEWDVGTVVSGTWQLSGGWEAFTGTVSPQIELSEDGQSWTTHSGQSAQGTARYARVRLTSDGIMQVINPGVTLRVDAVPRKETGTVQSSSTGPATVQLDRVYAAVQELSLTVEGQDVANAIYDNIVVGQSPTSFDVYVFDNFGQQLDGVTVRWKWEGV